MIKFNFNNFIMCRLNKQKQLSVTNMPIEKPKILIIDDDILIRKSMKIMLNYILLKYKLDYEIIEGEDGSDLIDFVMNDTDNSVSIIFTDENMNLIEGSEAISTIKNIKNFNSIKVISITSLEDEFSKSRILSCGADRVLTKPADRYILEEIITNYLT